MKIYDIKTDEMREMNQADLQRFETLAIGFWELAKETSEHKREAIIIAVKHRLELINTGTNTTLELPSTGFKDSSDKLS